MNSTLQNFKSRGLLHDISHFEELSKLISTSSITFYCGFDPTADSLHVGSLVPLIMIQRLQRLGHQGIALLGSATGMIGDPSGKSNERNLLSEEFLQNNLSALEKQLNNFFSSSSDKPIKLLRNDTWLHNLSFIEILRDIGKHFSVNSMIAKESIRTRLENRDQGISFTEFSYMILQAYDFYHLYKNYNCRLQIGGSDQWGNITAGIDLVRRITATQTNTDSISVFGLTFPLLTTSSGNKFGKTAEGTVWLDPKKTSPYKFYQYWLNTTDSDVINYLKIFTELSDQELRQLEQSTVDQPEKREAQNRLAQSVTTLVHGKTETEHAQKASQVLFGADLAHFSATTLKDIFSDVPSTRLSSNDLSQGFSILDLLIKCNLAPSKSAAKRLIEGGGVYLNNSRISDLNTAITPDTFIENQVIICRSGKKNYHLVLQEL